MIDYFLTIIFILPGMLDIDQEYCIQVLALIYMEIPGKYIHSIGFVFLIFLKMFCQLFLQEQLVFISMIGKSLSMFLSLLLKLELVRFVLEIHLKDILPFLLLYILLLSINELLISFCC